jgi:tRNA(adenine34) deaminase
MSIWDDAMDQALRIARHSGGRGEVPVGAVVLDASGTMLAAAGNERELTGDPTAHAEVLALRRAAARRQADPLGLADPLGPADRRRPSWRLTGCTLVVTLEPCAMCAGAAVLARVDRIVFGAFDPKAGAIASLFDVVRDPRLNHRPQVTGGVRAEACADVLRHFFASVQDQNQPPRA